MIELGKKVYFFGTYSGRSASCDYTAIYVNCINLQEGTIVGINEEKDYVHVYVDGDTEIYKFGFTFFNDYVFFTKREARDKMIQRIGELL